MSKYEKLNDVKWLTEKYQIQKWSAKKIAETVGCKTSNSVRQVLIKFGLPVRGYRDAQTINTEDGVIINDEVLSGTLLGDAHLSKSNKRSEVASPYYSKKCVKEDYTLYIASFLHKEGDKKVSIISSTQGQEKKRWENYTSECYIFRTNSSDLLRPYYEKWYPSLNDYKKIVPSDLILTPKAILYWYLDDGSSFYRKRNEDKYWKLKGWTQKKKQIIVQFCSESFTKEENEFLCNQLNQMGLKCSVRENFSLGGSGYRIFVNQSSTNDFFNLIGPCPVDSMKYKWKYTDK